MKPAPTQAAKCAPSPTKAHYWLGPETGNGLISDKPWTCKFCKSQKLFPLPPVLSFYEDHYLRNISTDTRLARLHRAEEDTVARLEQLMALPPAKQTAGIKATLIQRLKAVRYRITVLEKE